jgi:hypothetical protein
LHFVNPAIGFIARFLHDDRPFQIDHRAVGAEHLDVLSAIANRKFASGRDQLRFAALLDKIPDDLQVCHILASGVIAGGAGDQTSLAIHHVRSEAATVDFLQATNQELKVLHRSDHA